MLPIAIQCNTIKGARATVNLNKCKYSFYELPFNVKYIDNCLSLRKCQHLFSFLSIGKFHFVASDSPFNSNSFLSLRSPVCMFTVYSADSVRLRTTIVTSQAPIHRASCIAIVRWYRAICTEISTIKMRHTKCHKSLN